MSIGWPGGQVGPFTVPSSSGWASRIQLGCHHRLSRNQPSPDHLQHIEWRGWMVAVPKLELQLPVVERRRLLDRAALIRDAMVD